MIVQACGFRTLTSDAAHPGEGWRIATADDVKGKGNQDMLRDPRSGLGVWFIANLADGMEIHGAGRGYDVQPRGGLGGGHTLYCTKSLKTVR